MDKLDREIGGPGCDPYNRAAPRGSDTVEWQNPKVTRAEGTETVEILMPGRPE